MDEQNLNLTNNDRHRFLPLLLLLFVGSGCAALIYEIVWFQVLQLVIGSSAVSLAVLLGTFMGGMCLGSLALPRFVPAFKHPLRIYAWIELGIGLCGIAVLLLVPYVARLYIASAGHGFTGILLRGLVCTVCLLPPTMLMGATLPAIARWVELTPRGVSWLGFFYGGNIAGAVFGSLLAGFYLLRVHDMATATYVAAALNCFVVMVAFIVSKKTRHEPALSGGAQRDSPDIAESKTTNDKSRIPRLWPVYVTIALSGMTALGAEVIWTRLLSLMLGGTVYTFSIILAVFLFGLGIGSSVGSLLSRGTVRPRFALGCCQLLLSAAIAWTAYMIAKSIPYWPINPSLSKSPWFNFQIDLLRCVWAILPATILWGASFPLALAAAQTGANDPGRLVGKVYAANTLGAIAGALGSSLLLIPWIGTQHAQQVLIVISILAAVLVLAPYALSLRSSRREKETSNASPIPDPQSETIHGVITSAATRFNVTMARVVGLLLVIGIAAGLALSLPKVPWGLIAHGRYLVTKEGDGYMMYVAEGMNSSVAVTETSSGVRNFHVSGKIEASTHQQDMRLQRMLGHIPALLHPKPRSMLIVGCGAGVTAGSFLVHPDIEKVVICEIEPLIPQVVSKYFRKENYDVVYDPRVRIVYDDARHYVLTTKEKFDIITSDPIHPWVKGAATLYTKEYFEMCKRHLNPGGFVTQWVPLYESNAEVVKSEIATFFAAFPDGTIWSNDEDGSGYDVVLLGQTGPMKIDVDEVQGRLDADEKLAQSLSDVGVKSAVGLLSTYGGRASDLAPWLKNAEINRDRNLRLQYLAGMGVNSSQSALIYDDMVVYRKFPKDLFVASDEDMAALRKVITTSKSE